MKNMLQMLMASSMFLLASNKVPASPRVITEQLHEPTYLTVINNWHYPIRIEEGLLIKKETNIASGATVNWQMFKDSIDNLKISYEKDGIWQPITTCPSGSFDGGLSVSVAPANWDPNVPVCFII